jgi:hypothetical protein
LGYIRDDGMVMVLGPVDCMVSAGTWTDTLENGLWFKRRSAAAAPFYLAFTPKMLQSGSSQKGSYLTAIDLYWKVGTDAVTSLAATVNLFTLPADGDAFAEPATQTFGYDTGHDLDAERVTADEHKMTLTLDPPIWLDDDQLLQVELAVVATGTAVFDWYGAAFHFSMRL